MTLLLKPTAAHPKITPADLAAVKKSIAQRVDGLAISNAQIQTAGTDRVLVRLPLSRIDNLQRTLKVIGSNGQLEFREQKVGTEGKLSAELAVLKEVKDRQALSEKYDDKPTVQAIDNQFKEISKLFERATITGKNIQDARAQPLSSVSGWEIAIEFDRSGSEAFAKLTKKLAGTGRSIGIFLDDDPISTPTVSPQFAATGITGGKAVITGNFTQEQASDLALQLRSGSLPVAVMLIESRTY